jgi:hypothetical protein
MSDIKVREINKKRNQTTERKVENRTTVSEHTGYGKIYTGLNAHHEGEKKLHHDQNNLRKQTFISGNSYRNVRLSNPHQYKAGDEQAYNMA